MTELWLISSIYLWVFTVITYKFSIPLFVFRFFHNVFFAQFAFLSNGFSALSKFFNTFCSTEQLKFFLIIYWNGNWNFIITQWIYTDYKPTVFSLAAQDRWPVYITLAIFTPGAYHWRVACLYPGFPPGAFHPFILWVFLGPFFWENLGFWIFLKSKFDFSKKFRFFSKFFSNKIYIL